MFEANANTTHEDANEEIARHEVSEDGVIWRPYDPARDDALPLLHKRIEFAPPTQC
jgi:hypothetical protein